MINNKTHLLAGISYLLAIWLLSSCAQIVSPSGGAKDTSPPKIVREFPPNAKPGFSEKKIVISFDEFVSISNPEDQIVISPPLEEKPEYEISGKNLIIRFKKPPAANTTYTINFGNAIIDVHEGNAVSDYRYVFSTGNTIDTLFIKGNIVLAETNTPQKSVSICLYPALTFTDSTIYKNKPAYFAKSRDGGGFSLENLPANNYYLIGFMDENKNLKYDKTEPIAFHPTVVNTTDSGNTITQYLYMPDLYERGRILDTFCREKNKYTFLVYKPDSYKINVNNTKPVFTWLSKGKNETDSIFLFTDKNEVDSLLIKKDTSSFYLKPKQGAKKPHFLAAINKTVELNDSVTIHFSTPLLSYDTSRILLKEDTIVVKPVFFVSDENKNIKLWHTWKENTRYEITLRDSAFTDIYSQYSKSDKHIWGAKNLKSYSTLKLTFNYSGNKENLLILLISADEKNIYKTFYLNTSNVYYFDYLLPTTYKIKIVHDVNKNGKWDNGDFFKKRQPETVFYFPESITLRAYWDLEQTIDLNSILK